MLVLSACLALLVGCSGSDSEGGSGDTEPIDADVGVNTDGIGDGVGQDDGEIQPDTVDGLDVGGDGDTATGTDIEIQQVDIDVVVEPDGSATSSHEPFTCNGIDDDNDGITDEDCSFQLAGGIFGAGYAIGTDEEGKALENTLSTPTFTGVSEGGGYRLIPVGPGGAP